MANELPPITNPFAATTQALQHEQYTPQAGEKGLRTISTLFIVFGILGLLTLPGLLIGAAVQYFVPNLYDVETEFEPASDVKVEELPSQKEIAPKSDQTDQKQEQADIEDKAIAVPFEVLPTKRAKRRNPVDELNAEMQEMQKFNAVGFLVGLVNVVLSGLLVWSGLGLSKKKRFAAKLGIQVCSACVIYEIVRLGFAAWLNFQMIKGFNSFQSADIPEEFPIGTIMVVSLVVAFVFTLLYGIGKIVMYVLCSRYLKRDSVHALLVD